MAIEVKLSADCKTLTITGGSTDAPVELWINEVQYPMIDPAGSPTNSSGTAVDLEELGGINGFPSGELTITWDNIPGISTEQLNGVIKIIVIPNVEFNLTIVSRIFDSVLESRAPVNSSKNMIEGFLNKALAKPIR